MELSWLCKKKEALLVNEVKICKIIFYFSVVIVVLIAIVIMVVSALAEEQPSFVAKDSLIVISTNNLREKTVRTKISCCTQKREVITPLRWRIELSPPLTMMMWQTSWLPCHFATTASRRPVIGSLT